MSGKFPVEYRHFKIILEKKGFKLKELRDLFNNWRVLDSKDRNTELKYKLLEGYLKEFDLLEKNDIRNPWLESDEGVARKFLDTKQSAKIRGLSFDLSLVEIRRLIKTKTCFYTKVKLSTKKDFDGAPTNQDTYLTFDRVDSSKGYISGNVVACTHWANQLKNALFESPDCVALGKEKLVRRMMEKL